MRQAKAPGTSWKRFGLGASAILALTLAAYFPAMRASFSWDDRLWLWDNPLTTDADGIYRFWIGGQSLDYLPLTSSVFWRPWRLWGSEATGYHVVNILLHAANAMLLWLLLKRLKVPGAYLACLVFAVHPVNVASVAWVSELKNTLSMFFFVLAALVFLKFQLPRK